MGLQGWQGHQEQSVTGPFSILFIFGFVLAERSWLVMLLFVPHNSL